MKRKQREKRKKEIHIQLWNLNSNIDSQTKKNWFTQGYYFADTWFAHYYIFNY